MKRINANTIGIQQGSRVLFSDFVDDGPMWAGHGDRETRATILFPEAFSNAPSVHVAIGMWDTDHKHNSRVDVTATAITAQQFEIVFRTWGDTRIARVRIDWMAIGAASSDEEWQLY
jgi:hypothetical protein